MDEEGFKKFLTDHTLDFREAKSYAKTAPHDYIVKDKLPRSEWKRFEQAVQFIRDNGKPRHFYSKVFVYYELWEKEYWTYGDPVEETIILNRAYVSHRS